MNEEKKISRLIELTLGLKTTGPAVAPLLADINAEIAIFKNNNSGATWQQLSNHIYDYGRALLANNKGFTKSIADQQKAISVAKQYSNALKEVKNSALSILSPIKSLVGLVGGEAIGFESGIKWVVNYQKQMLGLSAQMSKYGRGLGEIDAAILRVGKSTGLTQKETASLYSIYEKGFPFNSLENGAKLFKNIKQAVGGNSEAMQSMVEMLQGVIDKFPELEEEITNLNEGGNKKLLESQSRLLFMTGKLSLAEHKRFQDYIHGGQQSNSADEQRRQLMQDQIDSMNKLRQVFENIARAVGETLLPFMQKLSEYTQKTFNYLKPYIPAITTIAGGLAVLLATSKAIMLVWQSGKMIGKLPGINMATSAIGGVGGGIAKKLGNGAIGAASGALAGGAVDLAYYGITGNQLSQDSGERAVVGQVAKTGTQIGAGFATGGIEGAIGASLVSIAENIYSILKNAFGSNNSIASIKKDVVQANQTMESKFDAQIKNLQTKIKNEQDAKKKGYLQQDLQIIQLQKQAQIANGSKAENNTGFLAATYRTGANFLSYLNPISDVRRLMGADPIAEREALEKHVGLGSGDSSNGKELLLRASAIRKQQLKQQESDNKDLTLAPQTDPYLEQQRREQAKIKSGGSLILDKIKQGDLRSAESQYRSVLDLIEQSNIKNVISSAKPDVTNTLQQFGVDTGKIVGQEGQSFFSSKGKTYNQLEYASKGINSEMSSLDQKVKDSGQPLSGEEQQRYNQLKQSNEIINKQLNERKNIQDQFAPQMQMLDAAFNMQQKQVSATNELLQTQKELVAATVANAQTTGNVNFGNIQSRTNDAISSLKEYNKGLKEQIGLEEDQLRVEMENNAAAISNNEAHIKELRSTSGPNGKSKDSGQLDRDNKEADDLSRANELLDIQQKKGVAIQQSKAEILKQLSQTETYEKQIVDTLLQQLDANKANVEYASANVSKAEALINIYDSMGAGLKASAGMRMEAAKLMGNQIAEEKNNLQMIDQTITQGLPAMIEAIRSDKNYTGPKSEQGLAEEAEKRMIALKTKKVNKETEILALLSKQAQMTKALRDGYASAVTQLTAGSGMFNKILVTQEKNMGFGLKYMDVLQSKTSGGIGGGKMRAGQFGLDGLDSGSDEAGYRTWDGQMSNNNDVKQMQKNALSYIQQRIDSVQSGVSGAMSAPNIQGAVLQQGGQNNLVTPSSPASINGNSADGHNGINVNLGGLNINYGDNVLSTIKKLLDDALANIIKQLGGTGRRTLPQNA